MMPFRRPMAPTPARVAFGDGWSYPPATRFGEGPRVLLCRATRVHAVRIGAGSARCADCWAVEA